MDEMELREKCGLKKHELISSNLGFIDILSVKNNEVTLGVLATGNTIIEGVDSVISKMKAVHKRKEG